MCIRDRAVEGLVRQGRLIGEVEAGPPGVAQGTDGETGQQRRVDALAHTIVDGQRQMVGGGRPVEAVAEDGVRGLQLGPEVVLRPGARAPRQQLPLHLGGQGQSPGPARLQEEIGVAVGDEDLVGQRVGHVLQHSEAPADRDAGRVAHAQDPQPVAAHGHRQVHDDPGLRRDNVRLLGAEGTALGTVVRRHGIGGERLRRDGLEPRRGVIHHQQFGARRPVVAGQDAPDLLEQRVRGGLAQRALDAPAAPVTFATYAFSHRPRTCLSRNCQDGGRRSRRSAGEGLRVRPVGSVT